jgi:hypothetical protein
LTGELFSADLNATFFAGAFLAGVVLVFLAGCVVVAWDLVFLAGDSSLVSAAFLLPRVGFSIGVSTFTGLSAFLVPRVAFLAGVSFLGSSTFLLPRVGFSIEVSASAGTSAFLVPRVGFLVTGVSEAFSAIGSAFSTGVSSLGSVAFLRPPRVGFSASAGY